MHLCRVSGFYTETRQAASAPLCKALQKQTLARAMHFDNKEIPPIRAARQVISERFLFYLSKKRSVSDRKFKHIFKFIPRLTRGLPRIHHSLPGAKTHG